MALEALTQKATQIRLVLLDIDGTLVTGTPSDLANVRFQLSRLRRFGIRFSVATGRTVFGASAILDELDPHMRVKWLITYNGAVVARRDSRALLERLSLSHDTFNGVLDVCDSLHVSALAYACDPTFDTTDTEKVFADRITIPDALTDFNGMPIVRLASLRDAPVEGLVAILAFDSKELRDVCSLTREFEQACAGKARVTTSGNRFIEIAHRESSKQHATAALCRLLGIVPQEVLAIGDNYNDIELLTMSGLSAAVANSPQPIKDVCHYVCRHEAAGGVVEVLRWLADTLRDNTRSQQAEKRR
jgi:Cof subfamily protein (haloacid dehalogenase superfamily)